MSILKALLYIVFVIGVSAILARVGWKAAGDVLALDKDYATAVITVEEDEPFEDVVNALKDGGMIESKFWFKAFSYFSHAEDKVTAGTYELNTEMDYRAIISALSSRSGSRMSTTVTIPEGYTIDQIFKLLEDRGVSTVEKLQNEAATHDYAFSFLQELPMGDYTRLEGYLFPDTYEFYLGEDPLYVLNKMLVNFDAKVTDEMRQQIADSGRTVREVLVVASLIEKETDGADQRKIASVIYNRLNNPSAETAGYLQIDAAIHYVTGRPVTKADYTAVESPYNTYLNKGLVPGPICNPGMVAFRAAMNPEETGYYYYALGDDAQHHFSKTLEEHQAFLASQSN